LRAGADNVGYAVVMEEIAAGEGTVATILSMQNSVGCMPVLQYGSEEQKRRFLQPMKGEMLACFCLTEPQAGSDAAAIKTRARRHGNRWVLNGTKQFISSGKNAQIAIVFAVTDPEQGKKGISAFLVPTDGPALRWPGRAQARPALLRHCAARFRRHRADPGSDASQESA
jgi:alkylation response protein AidB-like acyl-CoA dehydrogenase